MRQRYPNPPITEAILEIKVAPCAQSQLEVLTRLQDQEAAIYTEKRAFREIAAEFEADLRADATEQAAPRGSVVTKQSGVLSSSADRKQVLQFRLDGFALSHLKPYQSWEHLRDEARRLWSAYRTAVCPGPITRVALRYINRIDVPLPVRNIREFLRTYPEVSPDVPHTLNGMFMQLQLALGAGGVTANITEALVTAERPDAIGVILDFDVWLAQDIPGDDAGLWGCLEDLHERENDLFERSITDATRRLFA